MKLFFALLLILFSLEASSQRKSDNIFNTWIKVKITYKNGSELPEENLIKYAALKYAFKYPNVFNPSNIYYQQGPDNSFAINDGFLIIKSPQGGVLNMLKIESIKDTLVLIQRGEEGFEDPISLKYYFISEKSYQNSIALKSNDIHEVIAGDTIYNQCPKIYPNYKGESFQRYIYTSVDNGDPDYMTGRNAYFAASFIVLKNGVADSLKILQGIDNEFDKKFIKAFYKAKKDWVPAVYNKRNVGVYQIIELKYSGMNGVLEEYAYSQKAKDAYNSKSYEIALYYFDKALTVRPEDKDDLYRRGFCKLFLGNKQGACEDWKKLKELGGLNVDELLEKYCK